MTFFKPYPPENAGPPDRMCCMLCFKQLELREQDEYGDYWTYCEKCDCWTSHPPKEPTP